MNQSINDNCLQGQNNQKGSEMNCPVLRALDSFTGKWKLQIIWILSKGAMRYHQLRKALPMVTEKMLVQQLRQLEADQMVVRKQYPEVPPRVEYFLSDKSHALLPIFESLSVWADQFLPVDHEAKKIASTVEAAEAVNSKQPERDLEI